MESGGPIEGGCGGRLLETCWTSGSGELMTTGSRAGVFSEKECIARTAVMHEHYFGTVEMEALTMIDMIKQHVLPSIKKVRPVHPFSSCIPLPHSPPHDRQAGMSTADVEAGKAAVEAGIAKIHAADNEYAKATVRLHPATQPLNLTLSSSGFSPCAGRSRAPARDDGGVPRCMRQGRGVGPR